MNFSPGSLALNRSFLICLLYWHTQIHQCICKLSMNAAVHNTELEDKMQMIELFSNSYYWLASSRVEDLGGREGVRLY